MIALDRSLYLKDLSIDLIIVILNFLDIRDILTFICTSKEYYSIDMDWKKIYSNMNNRDYLYNGDAKKYCYYSIMPLNYCKISYRQKDSFRLDIDNFSLFDYPYLLINFQSKPRIINLVTMNEHSYYNERKLMDNNVFKIAGRINNFVFKIPIKKYYIFF